MNVVLFKEQNSTQITLQDHHYLLRTNRSAMNCIALRFWSPVTVCPENGDGTILLSEAIRLYAAYIVSGIVVRSFKPTLTNTGIRIRQILLHYKKGPGMYAQAFTYVQCFSYEINDL